MGGNVHQFFAEDRNRVSSLVLLAVVVVTLMEISPYCDGEPTGILQGNIPGGNQNQQQLQQNNRINTVGGGGGLFGNALNRQGGGLSFAIPGLSLLAGNGVNGGGNLFGLVTVTRTVVSTVSTVTTASFRTCIAPSNALMPCVPGNPAGRRKRRYAQDDDNQLVQSIQPTPAMELIIGTTTVRDADAVSEYLEAHKPSTQSVIYPPGVEQVISEKVKINPRFDKEEATTILYPSQETLGDDDDEPTNEEVGFQQDQVFADSGVTTETPELLGDDTTTPESNQDNILSDDEKARAGLGRTTTHTTVIRVTSVATSLATGPMATLTISYAGCLPQSLPVSGLPCP